MNPRSIELIKSDCQAAFQSRPEAIKDLGPLKGDTVVITGGTGFMGTWLTEMLVYLNDQHGFGTQIVLTSRSTDRFKISCPHLANRPDVTLIKADVRYMIELPKETNWLIHAAGNPDTRFHATSPIETMTVIADGTAAMLRSVDRCSNFKMMLNVSSGLIYGAQPLDLDQLPENHMGAPFSGSVSSAYSEAKRYAETLCSAARSQARIPVVTARPFAFMGPYQSLENPWAITNFIRDALNQNAIRVMGDGQTVRSYMYPTDMAYWMLRILTSGVSGSSYNVGSPEGITLERVANLISEKFNPLPEVRLRASGQSPVTKSRLVPDVSLAMKNLNLTLKVDLNSAIDKTIQWYRSAT